MAFPDDYRRVQMAGGVTADVVTHTGLPRQIIVDSQDWQLHVMDGVNEGGHKVLMEKNLLQKTQVPQLEGEALQIALGTDSGPGNPDTTARLWKASKLKSFFSKFVDIVLNPDNNDYTISVKDASLRESIRTTARLVSDLNEATLTGWYRFIPTSTINMPSDMSASSSSQAMMMVMAQAVNNLTQMILSRDGSGKVWIRTRTDGAWPADWILATGVTAADLAGYLKRDGTLPMSGKLAFAMPGGSRASFNLPTPGVNPSVPDLADGDIYRTTDGAIRIKAGGAEEFILTSLLRAGAADVIAGLSYKWTSAELAKNIATVGWNQYWQDVKASRTIGTAYQNTTGRPIQVAINASASAALFQVSADGVNWLTLMNGSSGAWVAIGFAIIPHGLYYRISTGSVSFWSELR